MVKPRQKGLTKLLDGRLVPEFVRQFRLPIVSHRPHKWAMVDMQTGQVFVIDPDKGPGSIKGATATDAKLLRRIMRKYPKL